MLSNQFHFLTLKKAKKKRKLATWPGFANNHLECCGIVLGQLSDQSRYLSEWDYILLTRKLNDLLSKGRVKRVQVFKPLHPGLPKDEEWFQNCETREIYCLVHPEEKLRPGHL